jgi:hypothetical protein
MPHTIASVAAALVANGVAKHDGEYSEGPQFPDQICWFYDDLCVDKRTIFFYNPGGRSSAEIALQFTPNIEGDWHLASSVLTYQRGDSYRSRTYGFTSISEAIRLIRLIDTRRA